MKFVLADSKIKFIIHNLEWVEIRKQYNLETKKFEDAEINKSQEVWSESHKTALIDKLALKEITPIITVIDQPSADLLAKCELKKFASYDDALAFIDAGGVAPLTKEEQLQEQIDTLALEILTLKGI